MSHYGHSNSRPSSFNRQMAYWSPQVRMAVLQNRAVEIEAWANERKLRPEVLFGIAEATLRLGRVPDMSYYGLSPDDSYSFSAFLQDVVLNVAEDVDHEEELSEATTNLHFEFPSVKAADEFAELVYDEMTIDGRATPFDWIMSVSFPEQSKSGKGVEVNVKNKQDTVTRWAKKHGGKLAESNIEDVESDVSSDNLTEIDAFLRRRERSMAADPEKAMVYLNSKYKSKLKTHTKENWIAMQRVADKNNMRLYLDTMSPEIGPVWRERYRRSGRKVPEAKPGRYRVEVSTNSVTLTDLKKKGDFKVIPWEYEDYVSGDPDYGTHVYNFKELANRMESKHRQIDWGKSRLFFAPMGVNESKDELGDAIARFNSMKK